MLDDGPLNDRSFGDFARYCLACEETFLEFACPYWSVVHCLIAVDDLYGTSGMVLVKYNYQFILFHHLEELVPGESLHRLSPFGFGA
ncbi:hypothetical protein EA472_16920 [Natrarchaeobius oligotrophus]|uniref:Uncharacterized protein n=1 Tax=Natrarchaeobius chitinivorans TaxID=1679083 RepID=A0A3N6MQZ8_NATCH|nr:hypothetical protein EA472_16920 [Natrarchaeobius chitinivorans]